MQNETTLQRQKPGIYELRKIFWRMFELTGRFRLKFTVAVSLSVIATSIGLIIPLGIQGLLDAVFEQADRDLLNWMTAALLLLFLTMSLVSAAGGYLLSWVGERMVCDLRLRLFAHLQFLDISFYLKNRMGELISRLTNDVSSVRNAVTGSLTGLLTLTVSLCGSIFLMVSLNWRLSMLIFLTVPVVIFHSRYIGGKNREFAREVQNRLADSTASAEEALGGIRTVKSYVRESYENNRYQETIERLFSTTRSLVRFNTVLGTILGLFFMLVLVLIFWFGSNQVLEGKLSAGALIAFFFYARNVSGSVRGLSGIYTGISAAAGACERIFEILDTPVEPFDDPASNRLDQVEGYVEFRNVSFEYEANSPVLKDLSFSASPSETVALIGPSGAGKTTLVNLLARFFNPKHGAIFIDNININDLALANLRALIGLVSQDVHLFSGTIRENILYGRLNATEAEMVEAARAANAHEFVEELACGYDTQVGEKGIKLSGGQRQRIAIARAILKDPPILLLDEATSSLDSFSESAVHEALQRLMTKRTTFIITHRLSSVTFADQILVINKGEIIQRGTHAELILDREGMYAQLHTKKEEHLVTLV